MSFVTGNFEKDNYPVNLSIHLSTTGMGYSSTGVGSPTLIVERWMHADDARRFFVRHYIKRHDALLAHEVLLDFFKHFFKAGYKIIFDPTEKSSHITWDFEEKEDEEDDEENS